MRHRVMELRKTEYSLNVQARYNVGAKTSQFFQLIPIYDDRGLHNIFQMTLSGSNGRMIELFVDIVAKQSDLCNYHLSSLSEIATQSQLPKANVMPLNL